jgi:WD40 repeat protein
MQHQVDRLVKVWKVAGTAVEGRREPLAQRSFERVRPLAFSPDGRILVLGLQAKPPQPQELLLWDYASNQVRPLPCPEGLVSVPVFHPNGRHLAVPCGNSVKVWEVASGKELFALPPWQWPVSDLTYSPDGRLLLTSTLQGPAKLELRTWAADTGAPGRVRVEGPFRYHTFTPDGRRLVASTSGSAERESTAVWDTTTGEVVLSLPGVRGLPAFSPDGQRLAVASLDDRAVRLFDTGSGQELLQLPTLATVPVGLQFQPRTGRLIFVGGAEVRTWDGSVWSREPRRPQ